MIKAESVQGWLELFQLRMNASTKFETLRYLIQFISFVLYLFLQIRINTLGQKRETLQYFQWAFISICGKSCQASRWDKQMYCVTCLCQMSFSLSSLQFTSSPAVYPRIQHLAQNWSIHIRKANHQNVGLFSFITCSQKYRSFSFGWCVASISIWKQNGFPEKNNLFCANWLSSLKYRIWRSIFHVVLIKKEIFRQILVKHETVDTR